VIPETLTGDLRAKQEQCLAYTPIQYFEKKYTKKVKKGIFLKCYCVLLIFLETKCQQILFRCIFPICLYFHPWPIGCKF